MQSHNDETTQIICMRPTLPLLTIYNVLFEISLLIACLDFFCPCFPFVPRQWSLKNNFPFIAIRLGVYVYQFASPFLQATTLTFIPFQSSSQDPLILCSKFSPLKNRPTSETSSNHLSTFTLLSLPSRNHSSTSLSSISSSSTHVCSLHPTKKVRVCKSRKRLRHIFHSLRNGKLLDGNGSAKCRTFSNPARLHARDCKPPCGLSIERKKTVSMSGMKGSGFSATKGFGTYGVRLHLRSLDIARPRCGKGMLTYFRPKSLCVGVRNANSWQSASSLLSRHTDNSADPRVHDPTNVGE